MKSLSSTSRPAADQLIDILYESVREILKDELAGMYIHGSLANGGFDEHSDIDFLVELEPGRSLLDLGGLQFELQALLERRVDVVTERGLKKRIRDRILREAVPV